MRGDTPPHLPGKAAESGTFVLPLSLNTECCGSEITTQKTDADPSQKLPYRFSWCSRPLCFTGRHDRITFRHEGPSMASQYFGVYRAVITNTLDPTGTGRVQVAIPAIANANAL